jgi:hypothetical protein
MAARMLSDSQLTDVERRVRHGVLRGEAVDLLEDAHGNARDGASWGPERTVRMAVLTDLLARAASGAVPPLCLTGARLTGALRLEDLTLSRALVLDRCHLDGALILTNATAPRVSVRRSRIRVFHAPGLRTAGDVDLAGSFGLWKIALHGARIGGELSLHGVEVSAGRGVAVDLGAVDVHLQLDGTDMEVQGEVNLMGAHIAGQLVMNGAHLTHPGGDALSADKMRVDDSASFSIRGRRRFSARGSVRLAGATIASDLSFRGAHLDGDEVPALAAHGIEVHGSAWLYPEDEVPFVAIGELDLMQARIRNQAIFDGRFTCTTSDADGERLPAITLESLTVRMLFLPSPGCIDGPLDLTNASVSHLVDGICDGSGSYAANLTGFTYTSLSPACDDRRHRLRYLSATCEGFHPHAYDQLAVVYRAAGRDADTRAVMIAKQRHRRETLGRPAKGISYILDVSVRYGYETWRAVVMLLGLIGIGWGVFAWAHAHGHLHALKADHLPHFYALVYSVDAVLPVVTLGQETSWSPTGVAMAWYVVSVLFGWLLGLGLIAYATATFFKE